MKMTGGRAQSLSPYLCNLATRGCINMTPFNPHDTAGKMCPHFTDEKTKAWGGAGEE